MKFGHARSHGRLVLIVARLAGWELLLWLGPKRLIKSGRLQVHRVRKVR